MIHPPYGLWFPLLWVLDMAPNIQYTDTVEKWHHYTLLDKWMCVYVLPIAVVYNINDIIQNLWKSPILNYPKITVRRWVNVSYSI